VARVRVDLAIFLILFSAIFSVVLVAVANVSIEVLILLTISK
jgi:hypothetical protein